MRCPRRSRSAATLSSARSPFCLSGAIPRMYRGRRAVPPQNAKAPRLRSVALDGALPRRPVSCSAGRSPRPTGVSDETGFGAGRRGLHHHAPEWTSVRSAVEQDAALHDDDDVPGHADAILVDVETAVDQGGSAHLDALVD